MRKLAASLLDWPWQAIEMLALHAQFTEHPDKIAVRQYLDLLSYLEEHAPAMSAQVGRLVSAPIPVEYLHEYGSRATFEERRRALVADGMIYLAGVSPELRRLQDDMGAMERFLTAHIQLDREQAARHLIEEVQQPVLLEKGT